MTKLHFIKWQKMRRQTNRIPPTVCKIVLMLAMLSSTVILYSIITSNKHTISDTLPWLVEPAYLAFDSTTNLSAIIDPTMKGKRLAPITKEHHGEYVVLKHLLQANRLFAYNESITLTTQATHDMLDNLVELSKRWDGPISVAVYAPCADFRPALLSALWLHRCNVDIANLVTFHFIFPAPDAMIKVPGHHTQFNGQTASGDNEIPHHKSYNTSNAFIRNCVYHGPMKASPFNYERVYTEVLATYHSLNRSDTISCHSPDTMPLTETSFRNRHRLPYPINVCRNIARLAAHTHYVMAVDIELYPSAGIIHKFLNYSRQMKQKQTTDTEKHNLLRRQVFVLPLFEIHPSVPEVPFAKEQLVNLFLSKKAVSMQKYKCTLCFKTPRIKEWLLAPVEDNNLNVFITVKRHQVWYHWEPFYIGTNDDPLYNEKMSWEGKKDKMTQMYEMCLLNYDLSILDNAFLVHRPGIKRRNATELKFKIPYYEENGKAYWMELNNLEEKHDTNLLCRPGRDK